MGKLDQIGIKRGKIEEENLEKFGRKVQKIEKKPKKPKIPKINAKDLIIVDFFPKTINAQYLKACTDRVDFDPKTIILLCLEFRC